MNPHAIGLVTKGVATVGSSTIGLSSKGYLIRIGEFTYIPPVEPPPTEFPSTPGGGGAPTVLKKLVMITVYAYGEKFVTKHFVDEDIKISIDDVEVIDNGESIVEVTIKNLKS